MKQCPVCEKTWSDYDATNYCDVHGIELEVIERHGGMNIFRDSLTEPFRATSARSVDGFTNGPQADGLWPADDAPDLPDEHDMDSGRPILSRPAVVGFGLVLLMGMVIASLLVFREVNKFYTQVQFPGGARGLKVGDNVYVLGRESGQVTDIKLVNRRECVVTLEIDEEAARFLDTETTFYVGSDKLFMGKKCVKTLLGSGTNSRQLDSGETVDGDGTGPSLWGKIIKNEVRQIMDEANL